MKKSKSHIKTNLIYGLFVVVPIAIIFVLLVKVVEILRIVAKTVGLDSAFGAGVAIFLSLVLLLFLCYAAGYVVRTKIGAWSFDKFEKKLLLQIPGYQIISNILKGLVEEQTKEYKPALIQLGPPGTSVLGFVMEENDNDTLTVFVPSVPAITIGGLHIVERKRVNMLEASHLEVVNCITEWGAGSNKFINKTSTEDPA
jgi:uncharacterized membrane protein